MFKRIRAIIRKEIYHILRDPRTLAIIFIMPVMMVLLYGYALNMDVEHIPIGILDHDNSSQSRAVIRAFQASKYFDIKQYLNKAHKVHSYFSSRESKAVVVIGKGFGNDRVTQPVSQIQLLVDGSDPTLGNASVSYANALLSSLNLSLPDAEKFIPLDIHEQFLYNPDLKGANFIIPGLVAVILMMVCALLTSITVTREKESGTMDMLLVSPVRPIEIITGKVFPYLAVAFLDAVFILGFAKLIFHIPLMGNLILLLGLSVIYVYCALGIGLFISSIAPTQQVAMMAALVATILPSVLLSGFIFPIFSMPLPIRALTHIIPARYYIEIIRGILLKSSSFGVLKDQAFFLAALGTVFLVAAVARFKTRVK